MSGTLAKIPATLRNHKNDLTRRLDLLVRIDYDVELNVKEFNWVGVQIFKKKIDVFWKIDRNIPLNFILK